MKKILLLTFLFCTIHGYTQNLSRLRHIDSLVTVINGGKFYTQHDSIIQDYPKLGLSMKTYVTVFKDQDDLKKFVNKVFGTREENGVKTQIIGLNSFYFDHNKLIKVEEFALEGEEDHHSDWYYTDDKPVYYTIQSEKAEDRAGELLHISATMLSKSQLRGLK